MKKIFPGCAKKPHIFTGVCIGGFSFSLVSRFCLYFATCRMVLSNFKSITMVSSAPDLVYNVLSKIQRKTPTFVHKLYAIGPILDFYMRKVKFSQQMLL